MIQLKTRSDLSQQRSGHQLEKHIDSFIRPTIESNHSRGSCPHQPTPRDPPLAENPDGEQVLQNAIFKDGENPVEQEEAISTLFNRLKDGAVFRVRCQQKCECHNNYHEIRSNPVSARFAEQEGKQYIGRKQVI